MHDGVLYNVPPERLVGTNNTRDDEQCRRNAQPGQDR